MKEFFMGVDLGQSADYTAIALLERITWRHGGVATGTPITTTSELHVGLLQRLPLNTAYPVMARHVKQLLDTPALKDNVTLAVDKTGVGAAVFDMLAAAVTCPLYGVTITGGDKMTWEGQHIRVPKRDLIGATQVALQNGTLKISSALPHTQTLVQELLNFKIKIDPVTAHDSYSSWRENEHDDLVLATALAVWTADSTQPIQLIKVTGV